MWIHLLTLGLIDGAGGSPIEPPEELQRPKGAAKARPPTRRFDDEEVMEIISLLLLEDA